MKPVLYVAGIAVAVAAGYFWGQGGFDGGRADTRPGYDSKRADRRVVELPHDEATWLAEQAVRNYDPCISCSTHFLRLTIERG